MEEKILRRGSGGELIERLPQALLVEILAKLDLESLCSAAPTCRALRSSVSLTLSSITSLDLSGFSPCRKTLKRVIRDIKVLQSLILDCSRLDDSSIKIFAKQHLQELVLLKCHQFSPYIFTAVGEGCLNLRLFTLEMYQHVIEPSTTYEIALENMLKSCSNLESLCIKFQSQFLGLHDFEPFQLAVPKRLKVLVLQPIFNWQANLLINRFAIHRDSNVSSNGARLTAMGFGLQSLSLVLDTITDELLISVSETLHFLSELCLEDEPLEEPSQHSDLTNNGLQSLGACKKLIRLSIARSKRICSSSFKRVNDIGVFLLAEGCKGLESVRLGGFSKVTDAGYISILHSCKNLERFEIINALFLSDLTFHDLAGALCSLVEVRLISCNLLTSEAAEYLSECQNLEVLDLSGCKSIADAGLMSITNLCRITTLDLGGSDITDIGLSALGGGSSPIASLCLRGCKRITDKGMAMLLHGENTICKTLSMLDLGYLPRVSDRAIATVAEACEELVSLCIRHCFFVSDASIKALGTSREKLMGKRSIRRLDLTHCYGLSIDSVGLLSCSFHGLRWLGIGNTRMLAKGKEEFVKLSKDRPGLSICLSGCEIGCKDGWPVHDCI